MKHEQEQVLCLLLKSRMNRRVPEFVGKLADEMLLEFPAESAIDIIATIVDAMRNVDSKALEDAACRKSVMAVIQ